MMFCKNCGFKLSDDGKFCPSCGTKIDEISQANEDVIKTPAEETTRVEEYITVDNIEQPPKSQNKYVELYNKLSNKVFVGGFVSVAFGAILFLGIVLVSLIGWGDVYLYGGYDYVATLTTISIVFMLLGFAVITPLFVINLKLKAFEPIKFLGIKVVSALTLVLIVLSVGLSTWGFIDYANEKDSGSSSSSSSSGGGYGGSYNSGTDKRIGLSLKVDSIKVSGSYTYVYCTVTNVSSKYVATRYRYVKVKAQFKNYSGSIVDTDSTYAVDSTWLEPGESKTFYYMVKNTNIKSATLSFVD